MRWVLGVVTGVALLALLALSAARFYDGVASLVLMAAAFSSYALVGYVVVVLLLLVQLRTARRRLLPVAGLVATVAVLTAQVAWWAPYAAGGSVGRADLVVLTLNLDRGRADTARVLREIDRRGVDVAVLEEVTPDALAALVDGGIGDRLRYRAGRSDPQTRGTVVFSRFRLVDLQPFTLGNSGLVVTLATPVKLQLLAVHAAQPVNNPARWRLDLQHIGARVALEAKVHPVLVVGDFNATADHAVFREILDRGVADAAEQAGSGWQPTWPTKWRRSWLRPLIAIDHVLGGRGVTALRTSTFAVDDTDHLGLVVDLRLPRAEPGRGSGPSRDARG